MFSRVSGPAHSDCRAYYLYGVCDETIQAAASSLRWRELIDGSPLTFATTSEERAVNRAVLDSVVDEQNLWKRKLTEHLVNAICFSQYNTQPYYRAFLAAEELDYYLGIKRDFSDFFKCDNRNTYHSIKRNIEIISDIQKSEGHSKLPFLSQKLNPKSLPQAGSVFTTLRQRFKKAITLATDDEKIVLGFSYGQGFSYYSKSMHALASAQPQELDNQAIESGLAQVALIATNLLLRAHNLVNLSPIGSAAQVERVMKQGSIAPQIVDSMAVKLNAGDIVFAHGDLAEIIGKSTSSYGYTSFKVRYLVKPPLPSIPEDEWPAHYISLLIAKENIREFIRKSLSKIPEGKRAWDDMKNLKNNELHKALKEFFGDLEKRGLLHMILRHSAREPSKKHVST
jgi:hypothetical protein